MSNETTKPEAIAAVAAGETVDTKLTKKDEAIAAFVGKFGGAKKRHAYVAGRIAGAGASDLDGLLNEFATGTNRDEMSEALKAILPKS